jgi:diguanylate cyclase (GGDEF)-like protein
MFRGQWQLFRKQDGLLADKVVDLKAVRDDEAWLGYADEGQMTRLRVIGDDSAELLHVKRYVRDGDGFRHRVWAEMEDGVGMISPDGRLRTFTQSDGLIWNDVNCDSLWQNRTEAFCSEPAKGWRGTTRARRNRRWAGQASCLRQQCSASRIASPTGRRKFDITTILFWRVSRPRCFTIRMESHAGIGSPGLEPDFTRPRFVKRATRLCPRANIRSRLSAVRRIGTSNMGSYPFTILAPWWGSWWARSIAVLLFGLAIWGALWTQKERARREKERLERAVAERSAELAQANRELQQASLSDPLTGVRNRRFFQSTILADASQAVRAYRTGEHYSHDHRDLIFFLIDIDHFKDVNDQHGHDAGDRMLVEIAQRLNGVVRESDFLIRWGGEEFLVVCRSAERDDSPMMAGRILRAIGGMEFDLGNDRVCAAPARWAGRPYRGFQWSARSCRLMKSCGSRIAACTWLQRGRNQAVGLVRAPASLLVSATIPAWNNCRGQNDPGNSYLRRPSGGCRSD